VSYSEKHLNTEFPGPITNESLLKNFAKYFRDDDSNDVTNFVTRSKIRERWDFKLITKEGWTKLHSKYGGFEIKREKDEDTYNRKYLIKFPLVPTFIHRWS